MYMPMGLIWPQMVALRDCLGSSLRKYGGPEVCSLSIRPGAGIPADWAGGCGDRNGQAWVRLVSVYPSTAFPQPATAARVGAKLAFDVELGVLRQAIVWNEDDNGDGLPPTDEQNEYMSELQTLDMLAMHAALVCCLDDNPDMVLGLYEPLGPDGDMYGGTWSATVDTVDLVRGR